MTAQIDSDGEAAYAPLGLIGAFRHSPRSLFRMSDRAELEALFLEHLGWIDKVASLTCGKNGVRGDDVEDFTSWVRMKIMEDDYAILRKFRGESRIMTYLATVVVQQFFNFERARRGRWRSSAMAELLGAPAAELERLVRRDGYTVGQAGETLRTAGRTTLSDAELARLLDRLPARAPLRPVAESPRMLSSTPGTSRADERVVAAEAGARQDEIMSVLHTAIKQLDPEDQLIVRMHFADGIRLADVARVLDLEQKPLYRRVGRLRARLRTLLEGAGLSPEDVRDLRLEPDEP